jgi:hypothetical protein
METAVFTPSRGDVVVQPGPRTYFGIINFHHAYPVEVTLYNRGSSVWRSRIGAGLSTSINYDSIRFVSMVACDDATVGYIDYTTFQGGAPYLDNREICLGDFIYSTKDTAVIVCKDAVPLEFSHYAPDHPTLPGQDPTDHHIYFIPSRLDISYIHTCTAAVGGTPPRPAIHYSEQNFPVPAALGTGLFPSLPSLDLVSYQAAVGAPWPAFPGIVSVALWSPSMANTTRANGSLTVNGSLNPNFYTERAARVMGFRHQRLVAGNTLKAYSTAWSWSLRGQFLQFQGGGLADEGGTYTTEHVWRVQLYAIPSRDIPWRRW